MLSGQIESPLQRVSLTRLLQAAGLIALTVAGLVVFVPSILALLLYEPAPVADWWVVGVPGIVWAAGFLPIWRSQRPRVQSGAVILLLMLGVLSSADAWLPMTLIGFAAVVAAVFTLSVRGAIAIIVIVSAIDITARIVDPPATVSAVGGLAPVISGALLIIVAGGGLLLAWHAWLLRLREAESAYEQVQAATEQHSRDAARRDAASAVTRRIHETVLNTLTALSMGVSPASEGAARKACRRDLEQMAIGFDPLPDSRFSQILAAASSQVPEVDTRVELAATADAMVTSAIANPLRDALVEALRNVARHAGTNRALIRVTMDQNVVIEVIDNGVGMTAGAAERFGMRNSIRSGLASIGGRADVQTRSDGGTCVTLIAPVERPIATTQPNLRAIRIVDSSLWTRLGLLGTNAFMLLMVVPVVAPLQTSLATGSLILAYVAVLATLALAWHRVPRVGMTLLAAGLLMATFLVTASRPLSCTQMWSIDTLLAGMSGGALLLPLVALNGWRARLALIVAVGAASSLVVWALPGECMPVAVTQWSVTTAYVAAFAIGLSWVEMVFERQRDRAQEQWSALLEEELSEEARLAASSTWSTVGSTTLDLLEGVADGSIDLHSTDLTARAAAEADTLRADLGLSSPPGDAVDHLSRRLVRAAARSGGTFELELLFEFTRPDHYPDAILELVADEIARSPHGHLILRGFVDDGFEELVGVLAGESGAESARHAVGDTTLEIFVGDTETHLIIRRPQIRDDRA